MNKKKLKKSESSFRDPSGYILFDADQNIYRAVTEFGKRNFDFVQESGLYDDLIKSGQIAAFEKISKDGFDGFDGFDDRVSYILLHEKIPFISYPYEWTFEQLQEAALLHLDIHLKALKNDVTLSDATAFNIQFVGYKPVFIDTLSFIKYEEGMLWKGQQQFVEQFLCPLLLTSYSGVAFNNWYRGTLKGIAAQDLNAIIPFYKKLSFRYLNYIFLPCYFEQQQVKASRDAMQAVNANLPKTGLVFILKQLRKWIATLKNPHNITVWGSYTVFRDYSGDEVKKKLDFVTAIISQKQPETVWDIGCNTGEFSFAALNAGTHRVVGLEFDHGALATAYAHSKKEEGNFLPLYMDLTNPSVNTGWNQQERIGLRERANGNFIMALAVIHHLVIGGNIPLAEAINYLVNLAPEGIIEWVPKSDSMIRKMLLNRDDIFTDYDEAHFIKYLENHAKIIEIKELSSEGRKLFLYNRQAMHS